MNKIIPFAAIAALTLTVACNSNENAKTEETPKTLAKVTSFNLTTDNPLVEYSGGPNVISYDSEGRIVKSSTGSTETTYVYSGDNAKATRILLEDKSVVSTENLVFDQTNTVLSETFDLVKKGVKGEVNYVYDDKGRIIKEDCRGANGNIPHNILSEFTYDEATGLITKARVVYEIAGSKADADITLEYSDKANPVAFYPEAMQMFSFNEILSLTGYTGYSRDRLVSKIKYLDRLSKRGYDLIFDYDFDADGKLTAIHERYVSFDENGNQNPNELKVDFTDIKY